MSLSQSPYGRQKKREQFFRKIYAGETYYDQPVLNKSPWDWRIGLYFFIGGLAGAAQILATVLDLVGGRRGQAAVRRGRYLAFIGALISPVLLIWDLHVPRRFYNMLRIFRRTSAMSIGTYILTFFSIFTGLTAVAQFAADLTQSKSWRMLARLCGIPATLGGIGMSVYTGTLLATTSVPLWAAVPRQLAALFGASAVASAAAALSLGERDRPTVAALDNLGLVANVADFAISSRMEKIWQQTGADGALKEAPYQAWHTLGVKGIGIYLPLGFRLLNLCRKRPSRFLSSLAAISTLVGSLILRNLMIYAGNRSAQRPRDYFTFTQPEEVTADG